MASSSFSPRADVNASALLSGDHTGPPSLSPRVNGRGEPLAVSYSHTWLM